MNPIHANEVQSGTRFRFGENWARFLKTLTEDKVLKAEKSMSSLLSIKSLEGKKFLDVGSGSGIFSLAAKRLGARVHSFDYDPQSVACTTELKNRYYIDDVNWRVEEGSILDSNYVNSLGKYDIVYSWGVLHHTGKMYEALENIIQTVGENGFLFIALYNDQGYISKYWTIVKAIYNKNIVLRILMIAFHAPYLFCLRWLVRFLSGRLPLERGMSMWHDMIDWLGGYPFETSKPEEIFHFFRDRGFILTELVTCRGRMGCNEFVFKRNSA